MMKLWQYRLWRKGAENAWRNGNNFKFVYTTWQLIVRDEVLELEQGVDEAGVGVVSTHSHGPILRIGSGRSWHQPRVARCHGWV